MVNISVSSITHNRPTVPRDDLSTAPVMTYSGGGGELKVLTAPQQNSIIKRLTSDYSVYNTHSQSIQTFKKAGEGIDTQWHTYPTGRVYNKWNRTFRQPRWLNSHTHTHGNTHTRKALHALVQLTMSTCQILLVVLFIRLKYYHPYRCMYPWIFWNMASVYILINTKISPTAQ